MSTRPRLSRRALVGAAWTVPVVQAVSVAPAFALGSGPPTATITTAQPVRPCTLVAGQPVGCTLLTLTFALSNTGGAATQGLRVLLDVQVPYPTPGTDGRATTTIAPGADFTAGAPVDRDDGPSRGADSSRQVRRFPLTATAQLPLG